jgi:hypothetical protein
MLYRNDQVDKAMTDGDWPHQVELPVYRCMGHNYRTMHFFCQELSLSPRTHPYRRDSADMTVFCFAEREHAKQFHARFGGELIDPATRPTWPDTHQPRNDHSAEKRHRNGRCINCDD